jgi:hypothetical protein
VKLTETAVVMAVTLGTVGVAWSQLDVDRMTRRATVTAAQVSCHTVDTAIAAYLIDVGTVPTRITDLGHYVQGDISAYRIDRGRAAGPGCTPPPA